MVRDLIGPVQAQLAEMGLLITLEQPTREMEHTARHSGVFAQPVNHHTLFPYTTSSDLDRKSVV